jgi:hypothetical protein
MSGAQIGVGSVMVATTSDGGHPPEFYVEGIIAKLMHVSETAPPVIREQAKAYRETLRQIVLTGVKGAILSSHTTTIAKLRKAGMQEAASLVYDLHRR